MPFGNIGAGEIIVVLVLALLVLGPKRLPEVGRSLGRGMRELKDSLSGINIDEDDINEEVETVKAKKKTEENPSETETKPENENAS